MKITIKRAFERTRQIADFVPIKAYCEASAEVDFELKEETSQELSEFVQSEVEKTLMGYKPSCVACGGKEIVGGNGLNKEGLCKTCATDQQFKANDFKGRKN